jgi:hypothetical protein
MEATDLEAKLLIEQKKSSADVRSKLANQKQKQRQETEAAEISAQLSVKDKSNRDVEVN